MKNIFSLFMCDLSLQWKNLNEWAPLLLFFIIVIVLLPFAIGPDPLLLQRLAPGLIWLAALLMTLLGLDRLFTADQRDGTLDLLILSPLPLPLIVFCKVMAQSVFMVAALSLSLLPAALLLGMDLDFLPVLSLSLLLGIPCLIFLGAMASAITVSLSRNPALLILLLVPFYVPILIFGVGACDAAISFPENLAPNLLFLAAILAFLLPAAPFVVAAALKSA